MSRVTIIDLVTDYEDADIGTCKKSRDIQVVPRKMVEMIIEKCQIDERAVFWNAGITDGVRQEATTIKDYAESLLKQFEEDD